VIYSLRAGKSGALFQRPWWEVCMKISCCSLAGALPGSGCPSLLTALSLTEGNGPALLQQTL